MKTLTRWQRRSRNKTTLVSGNSGVGKSTLLNRLNPSLSRSGPVQYPIITNREGTSQPSRRCIRLPGGGFVIDTPGISGFGVIDFDRNEIYHFFPEIFRLSSGCRFYNCLHLSEPGCAVRTAVAGNEIEPWRYKSYVSMMLGGQR
ncbi:MAG: ribosome small subunit-dependent GTPase A [Marinilabiliales bacterium]|nr:ribosome small subunit-dependent GTPase A [Marinilabiliales bacterium]